jgi:D-sedoheptulose 7-phosphate isomerase
MMLEEEKNAHGFLDSYFLRLKRAQEFVVLGEVSELFMKLLEIRRSDSTLFLAGNGGSASTSQHFAVDLGIGGLGRNSIIRSICLSDNQSSITALANDISFDSIFAAQLSVLGKDTDALMVISASGNSANLISAINQAKQMGIKTLGLLGFDGGELRGICDYSVLVETNKGEYGIVEDIHLSICHALTEALRRTD